MPLSGLFWKVDRAVVIFYKVPLNPPAATFLSVWLIKSDTAASGMMSRLPLDSTLSSFWISRADLLVSFLFWKRTELADCDTLEP